MAAVTAAHRLLKLASQWENEPLPTVVWGFPYLDTLKVSQLAGPCHFFGRGDEVRTVTSACVATKCPHMR